MPKENSRIGERMENVASQAKETVGEHAMTSVLIAYALGVGVGLTAVSLLVDSGQRRHVTATRRLGQQLLDAMTSIVPDSLVKR